MEKLKNVTLEDVNFIANGNKYFIEPQISIERFKQMQKLEIEFSFGSSYKELMSGIKECYASINKGQFGDSAVILHNLMNSISNLESREHPILEYCALFINREGEDRRAYDEKINAEKIIDWKEEGIAMHDFFKLAVNMVSGLKENYLLYTQSISATK